MAKKKKNSVISKEVYHGGIEKELHPFKSILWFTEDFEYAYGFGPNIICANIDIYNPFYVGNTDAYVKILGLKFSDEFIDLAERLNLTAEELLDIYPGDKTDCNKIFNLIRTKEFRNLIENKGYDGVCTVEEETHKCWGVFNISQVHINSIDEEDEDWFKNDTREIKFNPTIPLKENTSDELKIYTETTGYYDGQVDKIKYAYLGKTFVGYLQYSVYEDEPYIQMIEVAEDYKRQGIATKLLKSLQNDYPKKSIHTGLQTDEGSKLFDKVSVVKKNPVYTRYENELKKIDKQIEEIDKKWEDYYNSDMTTMTDKEVEELNKLDNSLEDKRWKLQQKLKTTTKSHRYIKEDYVDFTSPNTTTKVLITSSPYEVKNYLLSSNEPLRIFYDKNTKLYMVGKAEDLIHEDLLTVAAENGYYNLRKWEIAGYIYDNVEEGKLYYILYAPKGKEKDLYGSELGEDDYNDKYEYDFGTITTRDSAWNKVPLSKALGKYNKHTQLGWKKDPKWGDWVKDIKIIESLHEASNFDIDFVDMDSRGWIIPNGKIISTHNGPHYDDKHQYEDQSKDIRYNFGYERYIGLPETMPTEKQFKTLSQLLDYYFIDRELVGIRNTSIEVCYDMDNVGNFKTETLSPKEYTADDVIKHIKRMLSHYKTNESIEEDLSEEEKQKLDKINNFIDRIYKLRQESIQKDGEFGIGNLVFKEFRNMGYLEYLKRLKNRLESKNLSLEGLNKGLVESISMDEVKDIFTLDNFKRAAEEYIVEDPSTVSKCYIDTDGEIYNVGAIADTHASWVAQIFNKIYEKEKGKSWYSEFEEDEDIELQQFFDDIRALLDDWGFIQCSTDLGGYVAISKNPTGYQYLTLLDWLYGIMEKGSSSVEVSLFTDNWTQHRYNFSEDYLPEDVIKSIKKAIATKGNLQESIIISPMTPYMLRNDGVLLECGSLHPYVNISSNQSFEDSYEIAKENPRNIKWFINNTNQDEVKKLGEKLLKDDLTEEEFNRLNDLTNQEFCRVRTSNFKVRFGGDNGEIYFRISSKDFNWFDLIWKVVMDNKNVIKNVTVVKDTQSLGGKEFNYYLVDGKKLDHLDVEEFLTLKGNPIIESKEDNEKFKNWLNDDDLYDKFMQNKKRLKDLDYNTDIYWLMKNSSPSEVKRNVDYLLGLPTRKEQEKRQQEGAKLLYDKNGWKIYEIFSYEASCKYGRGTSWCIANTYENDSSYFDDYIADGARIFIVINDNPVVAEQYKTAVVVYPNKTWFIWDEVDYEIPYIKDFPRIYVDDKLGYLDVSEPKDYVKANLKYVGIDFNDVDYITANYSDYFEDYVDDRPILVYMKDGNVRVVEHWDTDRVKDVTDDFYKWAEENE